MAFFLSVISPDSAYNGLVHPGCLLCNQPTLSLQQVSSRRWCGGTRRRWALARRSLTTDAALLLPTTFQQVTLLGTTHTMFFLQQTERCPARDGVSLRLYLSTTRYSSFSPDVVTQSLPISPLCVTYSVIKQQFLSYHAYMIWEVKNPLSR